MAYRSEISRRSSMKDSLPARPLPCPGVPPGSASSPRANHRLSVVQEEPGHRPRKERDDELFRASWHRFIFLLNLEEEAEMIYLEKKNPRLQKINPPFSAAAAAAFFN